MLTLLFIAWAILIVVLIATIREATRVDRALAELRVEYTRYVVALQNMQDLLELMAREGMVRPPEDE